MMLRRLRDMDHHSPHHNCASSLTVDTDTISLTNISTWTAINVSTKSGHPDSKVHKANMGPTWVLSAPDGPHVGSMNLAIRAGKKSRCKSKKGGSCAQHISSFIFQIPILSRGRPSHNASCPLTCITYTMLDSSVDWVSLKLYMV